MSNPLLEFQNLTGIFIHDYASYEDFVQVCWDKYITWNKEQMAACDRLFELLKKMNAFLFLQQRDKGMALSN